MTSQPVESKPAPAPGSSQMLWEAINDRLTTRRTKSDSLYKTPLDLWDAACEYFAHVRDNPVEAPKLSTFEGQASVAIEPRPKVPSMTGLYAFLGIHLRTWQRWENPKENEYREDLAPVMETIKDVIFDWKFNYGTTGLANAGLIARDLGLGDKLTTDSTIQEKTHKDDLDESRIANEMHPDATPEELDKYYAAGKQPPLYSKEQLDAGAQFIPYIEK